MASSSRSDVADDLVVAALRAGQTVRLRAAGSSMRPTVRPGDLLLVRAGRPRPGEIALARVGPDWIAHRVVRAEAGGFVVCGDHWRAAPHFVSDEAVVGVVVSIEPQPRTMRQRLRDLVRRTMTVCRRAIALGQRPT